jgi:hypothetical protein
MTPQEIRQIVETVVANKQIASYWYLLVLLMVAVLSAFLGAYLSKKGTNLADKEDVALITEAIEQVKVGYAKQLEAFKQELESRHRLQERSVENDFILSAKSHMAETAFDKHVEFCEEYVARLNDALFTLFRVGPSPEAWKIAGELRQIRLKFALWETKDIAVPLERFEHALRMIGINKTSLPDVAGDDERAALIHEIYASFKEVMSLEALPDKPPPEIAISNIIAGLQEHVGISKLTDLRKHFIIEAGRRIK